MAFQQEYPPVVICGPSGVGKGTLIDLLQQKFPDQFGFSVSHTTRPPRPGEQDGVHYHFTTVENIKKEIADEKFIEYAAVHGKYYGTCESALHSCNFLKPPAVEDQDPLLMVCSSRRRTC